MTSDVPPEGEVSETEQADGQAQFIAGPVPARRNQMMAAGLAGVALIVLAIAVTLVMLIHYENLPSLFSYFS